MPTTSFLSDDAQHAAMASGQRYHYPQYLLAPSSIAALGASANHANVMSQFGWQSGMQNINGFTDSPLGTPYSETGSGESGYYHLGEVASSSPVGYPESSQRTHLPDAAYAAIYQTRFGGELSAVGDLTSHVPHNGADQPHALHSTSTRHFDSIPENDLSVQVGRGGNGASTAPARYAQLAQQRLVGATRSAFQPDASSFNTTYSPPRNISSPSSLNYLYTHAAEGHGSPTSTSVFPYGSPSTAIARFGEPGNPAIVPPLVYDGEAGDEFDDDSECSLPSASSEASRSHESDMPRSASGGRRGSYTGGDWSASSRSTASSREDSDGNSSGEFQSPPLSPEPRISSPPLSPGSPEPSKTPKKTKMHQCGVCQKWFPRPSGLATHMNSHSGARPFKCPVPSCTKSFAVRSNAKRHLRTHGIFPNAEHSNPPAQFTVGFDEPIVSDPPQVGKLPTKLRWVPQSLSTRTNVDYLKDATSDSEDEFPTTCPVVSVPLPAVVPKWDGDGQYEERNSYERMGMSPYLASQWRGLPGPAIVSPPGL